MKLSILAGVAMLAATLSAQQYVFVPSDTPTTGGGNVIPFGTVKTSATWVNQVYQTRVPASVLGNVPLSISSLAFACGTSQVKTWDQLKITMAQTTNNPLSSTFANNLQVRPTVVFDGKGHIWPVTANQWDNIGLQRTFLYIPAQGDLVIEILAIGNHRLDSTATVGFYSYAGERLYAFTWTGTPPTVASGGDSAAALKMRLGAQAPAVDNFGKGCGPGPLAINGSGTGQVNTSVSLKFTGGPSAGAGIAWLSLTNAAPLPIDLTGAGYTGCTLWCGLDVILGAVAYSGGSSTALPIAIPNDNGLAGFSLYFQGLAIEPAAPGGLSASDMLRLLIGL